MEKGDEKVGEVKWNMIRCSYDPGTTFCLVKYPLPIKFGKAGKMATGGKAESKPGEQDIIQPRQSTHDNTNTASLVHYAFIQRGIP